MGGEMVADDDGEWDDRDDEEGPCRTCGGEGWGVVGLDWVCDDPINGPYDGEVDECPNCHGSGLARDMTYW
jgi:hypothetical protein